MAADTTDIAVIIEVVVGLALPSETATELDSATAAFQVTVTVVMDMVTPGQSTDPFIVPYTVDFMEAATAADVVTDMAVSRSAGSIANRWKTQRFKTKNHCRQYDSGFLFEWCES